MKANLCFTNIHGLHSAASICLLALLSFPCMLNAAEGGYSNYVPGTYGDFGMAVAPTEKWTLRNDVYYYRAKTDRAMLSGKLGEEIELDLLYDFTTLLYMPDFEILGAKYAGGIFNTTVLNQKIKVNLSAAGVQRDMKDSGSGLGDLTLIPLSLYWEKNNFHWTVSQFIVAPTGSYDMNDAMNNSLNYWSFDSNFALEYLNQETGWDLSFNLGYIYNTENNATDYHTGQELHLDYVINRFLSDSFALGLQGFVLKQITGDHGSGAQLGSFKGEAAGIGPAMMWSTDFGQQNVTFIAKWMHEFHADNRLKGDHVFLSFVLAW